MNRLDFERGDVVEISRQQCSAADLSWGGCFGRVMSATREGRYLVRVPVPTWPGHFEDWFKRTDLTFVGHEINHVSVLTHEESL